MTSFGVVKFVLVIEVILLVIALGVVFWHAITTRTTEIGRAPLLERGRAILYRGLEAGALDDGDLAVLRSYPRDTQIKLFADLAPSLIGEDREWLAQVADRIGLIALARERANSRRWWRRLNAGRLFTLFGRVEAPVFHLAKDPHPLVRAQAAEAFAPRPGPSTIAALIDLVCDPHPLVRFMARDSLIRIGRPAHEAIVEHISNPGDRALAPLLSIAATSPAHEFLTPVVNLLSDPRTEIRGLAVEVLRSVGGAEASAMLARMLDDSSSKVRIRAMDGLAALGYWPASPAIAKRLQSTEWQERYRAALALQNLGGPGELLLRRESERDGIAAPIARRVLDAAAQLRLEGGGSR